MNEISENRFVTLIVRSNGVMVEYYQCTAHPLGLFAVHKR